MEATTQPEFWLGVAIALLFLLSLRSRHVRALLGRGTARLRRWAVARAERASRPDPEAEELYRVVRRQRLCADIERVGRLVATDSWMSATRPLGNRLAYETLLHELRRMPPPLAAVQYGVADRWSEAPPAWMAPSPTVGHRPRTPSVEVIDLGWRA